MSTPLDGAGHSGPHHADQQLERLRASATVASVPVLAELAPRIASLLESRLGVVTVSVLRLSEGQAGPELRTVSSTETESSGAPRLNALAPPILRAVSQQVRMELPGDSPLAHVRIEPFQSGDVLGAVVVRAQGPTTRADPLLEAISVGAAERLATPVPAVVPDSGIVLDQLGDGIVVLSPRGIVTLLNDTGARLFGVPRDSAIGRKIRDLVKPGNDPTAHLVFREIERGATRLNADVDIVTTDGRSLRLAVDARRLGEGVPGALLSFRDVTEARKRESELRQARDFLERLIDSSSDAIVAADVKGRLIVFNRAAEKLFEIPIRDVKNAHVADLYPEGGAREIMRLLREAPDGKIEAVRTYGRTRNGELVPVEVSASLLKEQGREHATVGLLRDLRERVRVESELAKARARLLDAEKQGAVTALAGATAHELNQPLTVILGYVEILRRRIDPASAGPLQSIADEAERMASIVKKIARLTRVETMPYVGDRQIADLERSSEPPPSRREPDGD